MLKVKIARTYTECETLCNEILNIRPKIIGLDTETTIVYGERKLRPVSILQLCIEGDYGGEEIKTIEKSYTTYIICLVKIYDDYHHFPAQLKEILSSKTFIKTGCDIRTDLKLLCESYDLEYDTFVDVQHLAMSIGIPNVSMKYLSSIFLKEGKNLDDRLGIWHNALSESQIKYAAIDAYLSIKLFQTMLISSPPREDIVENTRDENIDFLNFMKNTINIFGKNGETTRSTIINATRNSYQKWRNKYVELEIEKLTIATLKDLEKAELLYINGETISLHKQDMDEDVAFLNFLKNKTTLFNTTKNIQVTKLISVAMNSYSPWKKIYPLEEIARLAKEAVENLHEKGLIIVRDGEIVPCVEGEEYINIMNKVKNIIPPTGIKKDSLINVIYNSNWTTLPVYERKKKAVDVIMESVANGLLLKTGDKLICK